MPLLALLLGACRVGPVYEPPTTIVPDAWKNEQVGAATGTSAASLDHWWELFDDPTLNALEIRAMQNSPNLDVAFAKVMEARAQAAEEAASLYPQLTLDPSFYDTGQLFQFFLPPGFSSIPGAPTSLKPFRVHQMQYMMPLNLNYEIDLWGKLRDRFDSAVYNAEAEQQAYNSVLLSLGTDLASSYFQLRALHTEIELLEKTIKARQSNFELTQSRYKKGLVNILDVRQAEVDLANAKASLDDAERMRNLAENQIAVFVGSLASDFQLPVEPLRAPPPRVPPGLPSTLLLKRPDIAEAERQMASEHALIGAAYASFFPAFSLTGALGYASPDIRQFLKWISRYWALGANMSQMVFDGGRDCANLQLAIARFNQASGAYQQQVLNAFQEVENALVDIEQYEKQTRHLKEAADAANQATTLSKHRYVNGVAIYLEVVDNERLALQAEINWVHSLNAQYTAAVQLIKAMGGSVHAAP